MIAAKARPSWRRCAPGALLLALPLLPLLPLRASTPPQRPAAPPPQPAPPQRFEEATQVVSVEVPVNAVDRYGKPVRGLKAADFEVFDEGSRQAISHFEVVDLDALRPDQAAVALAPGAIGTVDDLDAVDAAVRRHFLLLFDISFSSPTAVLRARLAARDFVLKSLRPTDLVAVATTSLESGPRLVLTFTPDRAQLAHAIDTLGLDRNNELAAGNADPLRFILASPSSISVESNLQLLASQSTGSGKQGKTDATASALADANAELLDSLIAVRAYAQKDQRAYASSQITAFTRGMGSLAKALSSLGGRKTVVYFSQGFDSSLLLGREDLGGKEAADEALNIATGNVQLVDPDQRFGNTSLKGAVNRMLEEFRRADCVVQAIDISGLRTASDATDAGQISGQEALFYMANETGGELFKDANNFGEQLERVIERSNLTYLLAFQRSDLKADGAYHRLRVKSRAPGVRLSYRTGYYAPRPYQQLDPMEKNLLAADGIARAVPRSGLDMSLLVAPFRASEKSAYVPVIIELPGRTLVQGEKGDRLNLELYAYVSNAQGQMADFFTRRFALDVKKGREALQATGVKYYGHLELPAGDYRVRVLARDSDSGRTAVRSVQLSVPAYKKREPVLLPPLFIEARHNWVLVRERPKQADATAVVYPFTLKGEPYVPVARPALGSADKARLCLVGYNLGAGDLALEGHVTAADGSPLSGGDLTLVERTPTGVAGQDELLATFQPTGLGAGDYVLRVALTDPKTGHKEVNSLPFQVVQ
ncbi:MAG: VWA domain-containing protein [Acidobacteria bacterium]|nr:VWA domain-containing protein [Acidobacteriota bacterium]